jgi:hypothetical protein
LGHGGPQPVIYATDINIIRLQENWKTVKNV